MKRLCRRCKKVELKKGQRIYCAFCTTICGKCEQRTKWKRSAWCQPCTKSYLLDYYEKNKPEIQERSRSYYRRYESAGARRSA